MAVVSVVIPGNENIRAAVDSALRQTLADIEVICVNAPKYAVSSADGRVCLTQADSSEIGGLLSAGLEKASGKYVYFLMPGNDIAEECFSAAAAEADAAEADMLIFAGSANVRQGAQAGNVLQYKSMYSIAGDYSVLNGPRLFVKMSENGEMPGTLGMFLFDREFLLANKQCLSAQEESSVTLCLLHAAKVKVIKDSLCMIDPAEARGVDGYEAAKSLLYEIDANRYPADVNGWLAMRASRSIQKAQAAQSACTTLDWDVLPAMLAAYKSNVDLLQKTKAERIKAEKEKNEAFEKEKQEMNNALEQLKKDNEAWEKKEENWLREHEEILRLRKAQDASLQEIEHLHKDREKAEKEIERLLKGREEDKEMIRSLREQMAERYNTIRALNEEKGARWKELQSLRTLTKALAAESEERYVRLTALESEIAAMKNSKVYNVVRKIKDSANKETKGK